MKATEILAVWLICQLVAIGYVSTRMANEARAGVLDCNLASAPPWFGALFPLFVFTPVPEIAVSYCEGNLEDRVVVPTP